MTELWRKFNAWRQRDVLDAEMREEIEGHREMKAADLDDDPAGRRFWPDRNPVGLRVVVGRAPDEQAREIIAIVKDSKYRRLTEPLWPAVFTAFLQRDRGDMTLHVRTAGEPEPMLAAVLLTIFGLLAIVGLYGVMTYSVNRRRREIDIRLVLGAQDHEVRRLVMAEGLAMLAAGLVVGLAGALVVTRLAGSFLYGVMPEDLVAFGGAALLASV